MSQIIIPASSASGVVDSITGVSPIEANGVSGVAQSGAVSISTTQSDLHVQRFIVSAGGTANGANYTTVASAYAAAVAATGDQTVWIQDGTYTENITLTNGVNITGASNNGITNNVIIIGNLTLASGVVSLSNIQLETNGSASITVSGSAAVTLWLENVYINGSNAVPISMTNSNSAATINCKNSILSINQSSGSYYNKTSPGILQFFWSDFNNNTLSSTPSNNSAGTVYFMNCEVGGTFSTSSTGTVSLTNTTVNNGVSNLPFVTTAGSGTSIIDNCTIYSGTASAISVGTGTIVQAYSSTINSSNTNAITGAGNIEYSGLIFSGTSSTINTSTQTPLALSYQQGGTGLTAPGTSGNVLQSDGTKWTSAAAPNGLVTTLTAGATGIWTINPSTKWVRVYMWGGGGGGGSGRNGTTAVSSGGGGGGPGQFVFVEGPAQAFTGGLSYSVGNITAGGLAQSTDATNGNTGTVGNNSTLGTLIALGGNFGFAGSTSAVNGGAAVSLVSNAPLSSSNVLLGGSGSTTTATNAAGTGYDTATTFVGFSFATGGGGGSGANTSSIKQAANGGGLLNSDQSTVVTAAAGGIESGTINGANGASQYIQGGIITGGFGGGGGGGASSGSTGGTGGNGSSPGGGGGGGGGGISTQAPSGAGGAGGGGMIIIIELN